MLQDREPRRHQPQRHLRSVDGQMVSREQIAQERDAAVLKVIDTLEDKTGYDFFSPPHEYVRTEFQIIAATRGLRGGLQLPSTQEVAAITLSPEELQNATDAVYAHDAMSAVDRQWAGLPMGDDGLPMVADVAACMAYLDELDPAMEGYRLEDYFSGECSYSCSCHEHRTNPHINPEHRRDNLYRWGTQRGDETDYDPPGADRGRVKALRDKWRGELDGRNRATRVDLERSALETDRGQKLLDASRQPGNRELASFMPDPRYVQSRRDLRRALQRRDTTVPDEERPALYAAYVTDAQRMYRENGFIPPSASQILGPAEDRNTDLQPVRRGLIARAKNAIGRGRKEGKEKASLTPTEVAEIEAGTRARMGITQPVEIATPKRLELEAGTSQQESPREDDSDGIVKNEPHMLPEGFTLADGLPIRLEDELAQRYAPPSDVTAEDKAIIDRYGLGDNPAGPAVTLFRPPVTEVDE